MTIKSYITLCIAGIMFVLMAAVAVVSPHGSRFALPVSAEENTENGGGENTPETEQEVISIVFKNKDGIEVPIPLDGMTTFAAVKVTVNVDGTDKVFTATPYKSLQDWSGFNPDPEMIVIRCGEREIFACRTVDLEKPDNAYIIYADENGNPLDADAYGNFCLYVKTGSKTGFFKNVNIIDVG